MKMFGKKAYNDMCGCKDCNNCPHSKTGMRRDEQKQWQKDYEDDQLYPELDDEPIGPQWVLDIIDSKDKDVS